LVTPTGTFWSRLAELRGKWPVAEGQ